ncbi:hypothetical protein [Microbispora sp. GKU 823]|uniref:hypothetical protein n=1 Tax=Microbispora sp. GKU 823 TaxID=1652100 RepID=UPI0009A3CB47|nr:hypothetical protein [Microbispora sp. GKU 823]OPG10569.1 hypothetical protein B1L11_23195 [Microbispora sp. GKU 823]
MPTIFGREPALWLGLFSAALQMFVAFVVPLPDTTVTAINAVAAAVIGVWLAFVTRAADGGSSIQSAILGFAQAVITLGLAFGLNITAEKTSAIMAFLALLVAAFVRQNVSPKTAVART